LSFAEALGLAVAYLALKAWQLHLLLRNLGAEADWRRLALAFAVGELALTLPLGLFAQNWVLARTGRAPFGETAAATVVMLLVEIVVVLVFLAVVGIRGWPVVRPAAIVAASALCVLMAFVLHFEARRAGSRSASAGRCCTARSRRRSICSAA
jgi:hypothetical protein